MGTPAVEAIKADVTRRFPNVSDWGTTNCRKIAGSSRWSQHAWGNAWDIGGSKRLLDEVYAYLNANRRRLSIGTICWEHHGPCDAASHMDHIHVEAAPRMTGTPPCAGGTDSRPVLDLVTGDDGNAMSRDEAEDIAGDIARATILRMTILRMLGLPLDTDPGDLVRRVGLGLAGLALLVVGLVLIIRDAAPAIVGDVVAQSLGTDN